MTALTRYLERVFDRLCLVNLLDTMTRLQRQP